MSTKLDSPSAVEPRHAQSTAPVSASSTVSATSPKVSMFGAKAGFVIPKNKLSGSLVPIFRGGSKIDSGSMVKEEGTKQVQRKTKWGVDLTQDATVRKGKALAYQTRVEQITQQLKYGSLEFGDDQGSDSPQASTTDVASNSVENKIHKIEILEIERRELIGEILRLNPTYKAPPDYKPLLKEFNVPIPIKKYPVYNFIGLLLGPESNTQKRLEEETGARVRVFGTKLGSAEKHEITRSDIGEAQDAYEDLYVHVSADTYEKVDAAVALIELLLTPVSGNAGITPKVESSSSGINEDIQTANQGSRFLLTPVNAVIQTAPLPSSLPMQPGQPPFHPYHASWYPANFPPYPSSTFMPPVLPSNPAQFPLLQVPPGVPPYITHSPNTSSAPRTSSPHVLRPQYPNQFPPRLPSSATIPQPLTNLRPFGAMHQQIGPPIRPLVTPPVNFSSWSPVPNNLARPSMNPMVPPSSNPMRPLPLAIPSAPPSSAPSEFNVSENFARPPANFTSHPIPRFSTPPSSTPPIFSSSPSQIGLVSTPRMASSSLASPMPPPSPHPSSSVQVAPSASAPLRPPMLLQAPISIQPPQPPPAAPTSNSSTMPNLSSATNNPFSASPVAAAKPLRPISGDFTFQPLRTQPPSSSPIPPASQKPQQVPFAAPKAPSFRPVLQNSVPVATIAPTLSFPANTGSMRPSPPMLPGYPNLTPGTVPRPPQTPIPSASPPAYPMSFQQVHQKQQPTHYASRPGGSFMVPTQQLGGKPTGLVPHTNVGGSQIYDPFSPTASPPPPLQAADAAKIKRPETDAEYEDLMASVGVK